MANCIAKIGEWLVAMFAAVMRTMFPGVCIIKFTLCRRKNAKNFLPGAKEEISYLKKHKVDKDFLQAREWSLETEEWLLEKGNFSLVSRIYPASDDKLFCLLLQKAEESPSNPYEGEVVQLLRKRTPSNATLKWMWANYPQTTFNVAQRAGDIFNGYAVEDIPAEKREHFLSLWFGDNPDVWAERVFTAIINKKEMTKDERKLIEQAVPVLLKDEFDFSTYMEKLIEFNFDTEAIRQRYDGVCPYIFGKEMNDWSAHGVSVICAVLPKVWGRSDAWEKTAWKWRYDDTVQAAFLDVLPKNDLESFKKVAEVISVYWVAAKALSWLRSSYRGHEAENIRLNMLDVQARSARIAVDILSIMNRLTDGDNRIPDLRSRLVKNVSGADSNYLLSFFPFKDWEEETAKDAIRKLVELNRFPNSRIEELSASLQAVAREEQEIASEIRAIGDNTSRLPWLREVKLHARSEAYLLTYRYGYVGRYDSVQECGNAWLYIETHRLEDEAFAALCEAPWMESGAAFIRHYAEKWGLTEDNYKALVVSNAYSWLAPELRPFVLTPEQMAIEAAAKEAEQGKKAADDAFEAAKAEAENAVEAAKEAEAAKKAAEAAFEAAKVEAENAVEAAEKADAAEEA